MATDVDDEVTDGTVFWSDVELERAEQDRVWGEENDDDHGHTVWLAILSKQLGQAGEQTLDADLNGSTPRQLYLELVQIAAVTAAWAESILRRYGMAIR